MYNEYIKEVQGDLLTSSAKVRCHQVNCRGVMGAGLAKQVKEKYPEAFEQYKALCDQFGSSLLGHTQFVVCHDGTIIANLFAQDEYGSDKVQTNMGALDDCMAQVAAFCFRVGVQPAFPKLLGCGLAGGNWEDVLNLIQQGFGFKGAGCIIVEYAEPVLAEKAASAEETAPEVDKVTAEQSPDNSSETPPARKARVPRKAKSTESETAQSEFGTPVKMPEVTIYTDGSCRFNPGPGGWGSILMTQSKKGMVENRISGGKENTTNNEMELTAVKEALSILKRPCRVTLYSDSTYVVNTISKGWLAGWKKKGWVKKGGIANLTLWKEVDELLQKHQVTCVWVKGHADNPYNNFCDQMAQAQSAKFL